MACLSEKVDKMAASSKVRVAVNGALGRMRTRILSIASTSPEFEIAGAFDSGKSSNPAGISLENGSIVKVTPLSAVSLSGKGVLIDFSAPTGTSSAISHAQKAGWGLAVGTTG